MSSNPTHKVKILQTSFVTHNVKRFTVGKPQNYVFTPGQATEVAINKDEWRDEKRPFTFTSLNEDKVLEFTIKEYPDHNGVTQALHALVPGEELLIGDPWGAIKYEGSGVFIAGGAGITPFIAIFRDLVKKGDISGNSLIFSNKTVADVILEKELRSYFLSENLHFILTDEGGNVGKGFSYKRAYIDKAYLKDTLSDFSQKFYVCGPPKFVEDIKAYLSDLGALASSVVFEE